MLFVKAFAFVAALAAGAAVSTDVAAQGPGRVPVIFLHGIGGAVLAEKANPAKIYYGGVKETMDRFAKLELPIDRSKDLLTSVDVLRTAQLARGSSVDQYILIVRRLEALGYKEGRDLFMFHYDWRKSNFESADSLRKYIADKGLAGKPVDLIGHSMGGLVSTIYIQKYAGEQKVRNFVAMGTPFFGAVKAIRALSEGFAVFGVENFLVVPAGSEGSVYRVFASMESMFELLPTYGDCCHMKFEENGPMTDIDLIRNDLVWQRFGAFLKDKTGAPSSPGYLDRMRRNLTAQRKLVDQHFPANVRAHAVVSASEELTLVQIQGAKNGFRKHVWGVAKKAGDGTVAAVSARGFVPKENIIVSNREHQFIFEDNAIWPRLKTILAR
jgi:pimeloyl-ACP methyl ester carboxylesterase